MKKIFVIRLVRFLLMSLVVITLLVGSIAPACAKTVNKLSSADICVVYDNSASTYQDKTWCRYKYMLEIMASLVDYDNGGRLFIYPLCDVSLDGRESSASCEPISITSYADVEKISNMFTTAPANTPFEPVDKAYNYLLNESPADNKRLVILTDGQFNGFESAKELENRLLRMADRDSINIHYIGSGEAVYIASNESKGLYSCCMSGLVNTQQLLDFATDLCGVLFNQPKAVSSKSNHTTINIDSDSKVIVFADGKSSTVLGLTNDTDTAVPFLQDSGRHSYSTTKAIGFEDAPIDTDLESYISTFSCTEAGEYTLICENIEVVNIYVQSESPSVYNENTGFVKQSNGNIFEPIKVIAIVLLVAFLFVIIIFLFFKARKPKTLIFISYRRDGGDALAGRVADRLEQMGYKPFLDVKSMIPGRFNEQIYKAIDECHAVLLILTPNALDRCTTESDDWIRKEIAYAIKKQKTIIPILTSKFEFPKNLPVEIDDVRFMEGVTVTTGYFDEAVQRIKRFLELKKK